MQVSEVIAKKRDGIELSETELQFLLQSYLSGHAKDYQMSAWLMAVYFQSLTEKELSTWTRLMWKSGVTFPRENQSEYWIDKHSTGGVGDKPSLILVPLVHRLSEKLIGKGKVKIPMISGRGLGHSGGTLDKLDSVPGFSSKIPMKEALSLISQKGFFMLGQTEEIAPADKQLYALRDVTATVESIPLIVSSIMSKKLAESPNGIVFDVKTGTGAFMPTEAKAESLANALVAAAKKENVDVAAVITRMDEPLGWKVGNALEVEECAQFFQGKQEKGLREVVFELASQMVFLASKKKISAKEVKSYCEKICREPETFQTFIEMFENQGGSWNEFEKSLKLSRESLSSFEFRAEKSGILEKCEARAFGLLLIEIGGGRRTKEDQINYGVGFEFSKKCGDRVEKGDLIAKVFHHHSADVKLLSEKMAKAVQIGDNQALTPKSWVVRKFL